MSNDPEEKYKKKELDRELTEAEQKQVNEVLKMNGLDNLPEKCFKCSQGFSSKLLKEAKTKTGETKKLCLTCYDKVKNIPLIKKTNE
jgi:hypothetical protein